MDVSVAGRGGIRQENRALYENIFKMIDNDGGGGKIPTQSIL